MFRVQFRVLKGQARKIFAQLRNQSTTTAKGTPKRSNLPLFVASFVLGSATANLFPISSVFKEIINEKLPTEEPEISKFKANLEKKAELLPLFQKLVKDEDFKMIRAWNYIDENSQHLEGNYNISATTLSVPGGIAIKPYLFCNEKTKETVTIIHLGEKLCGYPFLIHGGILFTIFDEILKRTSSYKFGINVVEGYKPTNISTQKIELKYRFPTFANNFIVIKSHVNEDGAVVGRVEDVKGKLLVEGSGDFKRLK